MGAEVEEQQTKDKMKLGICMDGGEEHFLSLIEDQALAAERFLYVEIGVAHGQTLRGVWERVKVIPDAAVVGLELPTWVGLDAIEKAFEGEPFVMGPDESIPLPGRATVYLKPSTEALIGWPRPIDVAFIDGCHGAPCVMADFLALEPLIKPDGLVIFHDAGANEQGSDLQPHCQLPIGVRAALWELNLYRIPYSKDIHCTRPGWTFEGMLPTQNRCAVFRKGYNSGKRPEVPP